ncbi:DUF2339 domain-containing protein [Allokutzneria sp. A3M-2-11 16]|uniref:DUF2339 domain-containing protein n=1 Tax=Allokutzneria sp. A3M-2-11 16 TaxID=2962043 RepID=UPI0020B7A3BF|nr:DUF2339 domain-containing protein [Allokutzneria sp. A3M-2-11 16]MCP3803058.1 DUF2339 domain-containing protein [Allokutzneria sp. A3M-2-11 16]
MHNDGDRLLRLAAEIDDLRRRLGRVGGELRALREDLRAEPEAEPEVQHLQPEEPAAPVWVPPVHRESWGSALGKEGAGSRVLAWVGGAVTLLGIVLLLVLAIQRGWLGPLPRVLVGAAFGAGLVGAGLWLHRDPVGRTGAFALAATGIATLYLDVIAATTLYEYLPPLGGLAVGLLVAVGGLLLASRWESSLLAVAVVAGCAVCAPLITKGFTPDLVTFLLVLQVATAPVQLRRDWSAVAVAAGVPPLIASVLSTLNAPMSGTSANTIAAVAAGATGIVLALVVLRRRQADPAALTLLVASAAPALIAALVLPKPDAVLVSGGAAVVLLGVWAAGRLLPGRAGDLAGLAGLVAAMQATVTQFDGTARAAVLLGEAVLLLLVALWSRNRFALVGAVGFTVLGGVIAVARDLPPSLLVLVGARTSGQLAGACAVAVLIVAVALLLPWVALRLGELRAPSEVLAPWVLAGVTALYGAAGAVLCATLLIMPGRSGFLVGHVAVTVSWTVIALVLLVRGINVAVLRVSGLVLVGAAVVKLVMFDLSALDGMARVAAFLGAGLVLLVAGTRYARLVGAQRT